MWTAIYTYEPGIAGRPTETFTVENIEADTEMRAKVRSRAMLPFRVRNAAKLERIGQNGRSHRRYQRSHIGGGRS